MNSKKSILLCLSICLIWLSPRLTLAQGTAFTYQGRLNFGGTSANGSYDFQFGIFDSPTNGTRQGPVLTNAATLVSNGLFTVVLDFGAVFPGPDRWLDIAARTNGTGSFSTLSPRQALTPTPYAVTAGGAAAGSITSNMLASSAVTTDKIAPGAVKTYQIDDGGAADYASLQNALRPLGADNVLAISDLRVFTPTNGVLPALTLTINGGGFGTVVGFSASEGISEPYAITVLVQSPAAVDPNSNVGRLGSLTFSRNGRTTTWGGLVTACTIAASSTGGWQYSVRLESTLAYMALSSDYRVNQLVTASAEAAALYSQVTSNTASVLLTGSYTAHENLIQYAETDLNFFSRLLEQEGIFYLFDHSASPPTLLLGDSSSAYLAAPNSPFAYYGDNRTNMAAGLEYLVAFQKASQQSTLKSAVNTYDFQRPALSLNVTNTGTAGTGMTYEFGEPVKTTTYLSQVAAARQQRHAVEAALLTGAATVPDLHAGCTFSVTDNTGTTFSGTYVVTSVQHAGFVRVTNGVSIVYYANHFSALPSSIPFRPALKTPRPLAQPCTAVVTGPVGETTFVDQYGRIKVQFHWDRYGLKNDTSSAWLRVSTPMAGARHAMMFLPEIGDEVLVSFLEGDPDQPLVTGSLYNAVNAPPYLLPAQRTISTIKTVGTDSQANEIQFNDLAGSQVLWIRAAKDLILQAAHQTTLNGPVSVGSLQVNGGTVFGNLQAGQVIAGSSSSNSITVAVTFPKAFVTVPNVLATPSNDPNWNNVGDTFAATIRNVSTTGCVINIVRTDMSGFWSQQLRVNWMAWE